MAPVLSDSAQVEVALEARRDVEREAAPRSFQQLMIEQIKRDFGDMLGPDAALLDTPEGLDALARKLHAMTAMLAQKRISF
jgi:hypothetical protein